MKIEATVIVIDAENTPRVKAIANSPESASLVVTARSMQEAEDLLRQSEDAAADACRDWTPEEPKAEPCAPSAEQLEAEAKLEQIFAKATDFAVKRNGRFRTDEALYCARETSRIHGCLDAFDLGYMRGYNAAQRKLRKS